MTGSPEPAISVNADSLHAADGSANDGEEGSDPRNLAAIAAARVAGFPPMTREQSILVRAMLTAAA